MSSSELPPDGPYEERYETGELCARGEFKDGKRVGRWRVWDETGRLVGDFVYRPDGTRVVVTTPDVEE